MPACPVKLSRRKNSVLNGINMITVYGIKNCDTVKKALKWLDLKNIDFQFRDVRNEPVEATDIARWLCHLEADKLINKSSTTWRSLSDADKAMAAAGKITDLLLAHPTLMKRPLIEGDGILHIGFKEADWTALFAV